MSNKTSKSGEIVNPFPGLRPFRQDESHLFFGREGQSKSVLESLLTNDFVAVIGASGSGKSSLIYCGVIPEYLKKTGDDSILITTRPGTSPVRNFVEAMKDAFSDMDLKEEELYRGKESVGTGNKLVSEDGEGIDVNVVGIPRKDKGLGKGNGVGAGDFGGIDLFGWFKELIPKGKKVLLLVDQFEEIFRYKDSASSGDEVDAFVDFICKGSGDLLNVVLTMRSDFIGDCSVFQDLTDLINKSNYLIPQMTREDFRKAVVGPVSVGGATIDKDLVEQLLDEMGEDSDQLPVLQHALMRTWDYWSLQNDAGKAISVSDYEAVGRMQMALSDHANEAFDELEEEQKLLCEHLFKSLTEKGGDNRGVRRPATVKRLTEINNCTIESVAESTGLNV